MSLGASMNQHAMPNGMCCWEKRIHGIYGLGWGGLSGNLLLETPIRWVYLGLPMHFCVEICCDEGVEMGPCEVGK